MLCLNLRYNYTLECRRESEEGKGEQAKGWGGLLPILIDCVIFLSPFLDVTRMSISTVSFLALSRLEFIAYRMLYFDQEC